MSRATVVVVTLAFLFELGAGVRLHFEKDNITQAEQKITERENDVLKRESNVARREKAAKCDAARLMTLEDSLKSKDTDLKEEGTRLATIKQNLESKSTDLQKRDRQLTKREEEDDNQTFAIGFIQNSLSRIRENFYQQQLGGSWFSGAGDPPVSPDATQSTPDVQRITEKLNQFEARYVQLEESNPKSEAEIAGRTAALGELASACADMLLRGSSDSLQLQATIDVDLELLRDWARDMELSEDVVPINLYELVDSNRLSELESLQVKKLTFLREKVAVVSGLYQQSVDRAEIELKQIQEAKGKRPSDPIPLFTKAILEKKLSPENLAALRSATTGEVRTAAIKLRYMQLLKQQLVIRWWDVGIRKQYQDAMALLNPKVREQFRSPEVWMSYLDLLTASTPTDPKSLHKSLQVLVKTPDTVGEAVTQYLSKRYSDPVRAAELYVILEEEYALANGEVVTPEDRIAFKEWLAGHLSPGQAYEQVILKIDPLLNIFSDLAAINDPRAPHSEDRHEVEETRQALLSESSRHSDALGSHKPRLNSYLHSRKPNSQRLYGALGVLKERVGTPELTSAWIETALDGLSSQLDLVDSARRDADKVFRMNDSAIATLKKYGGNAPSPDDIINAKQMLVNTYRSIELRLLKHLSEDPNHDRATSLLMRAKQGYEGQPPPLNVKLTSDWGGRIIAQIEHKLPQKLNSIRKSTERILMRAEISRVSYEKEKRRLENLKARMNDLKKPLRISEENIIDGEYTNKDILEVARLKNELEQFGIGDEFSPSIKSSDLKLPEALMKKARVGQFIRVHSTDGPVYFEIVNRRTYSIPPRTKIIEITYRIVRRRIELVK